MELIKSSNEDSSNNYNEQYGKDLTIYLLDKVFSGVQEKTKQIENHHFNIDQRLNNLNSLMTDQSKNAENLRKCKEYYLKALNIRKEFGELNEKCINLKKKSLDLTKFIENDKKKNSELKIEEEKKIMPKIKRGDSLSSISSLNSTRTEATVGKNTIKVVKLKNRAQSIVIPKTVTRSVKQDGTDSENGSWTQISEELIKSTQNSV